jgi:hypothetical protein
MWVRQQNGHFFFRLVVVLVLVLETMGGIEDEDEDDDEQEIPASPTFNHAARDPVPSKWNAQFDARALSRLAG